MKSPLNEFKPGKFEVFGTVFSQHTADLRDVYREADNLDGYEVNQSLIPDFYKGQSHANIEKTLFLPDISATYDFGSDLRWQMDDDRYRQQLGTIKKLLLDDLLPVNLIMGVVESGRFPCGETYFYGYLDYGKLWLIELSGSLKSEEVLPELLEIALNHPEYTLKEAAVDSIREIGGPKAAKALCDVIKDTNLALYFREVAVQAIYDIPHNSSVPVLRDAIEETRNMTGRWRYVAGHRMPMFALNALGRIPTLDSLDVIRSEIDNGAKHKPLLVIDYEKREVRAVNEDLYVRKKNIEHWARVALDDWVKINADLISKSPENQMMIDRTRIVRKLIYQYDIEPKKDFYDRWRI
jgi:hypothetical protein